VRSAAIVLVQFLLALVLPALGVNRWAVLAGVCAYTVGVLLSDVGRWRGRRR
jgi:hypothetical protein